MRTIYAFLLSFGILCLHLNAEAQSPLEQKKKTRLPDPNSQPQRQTINGSGSTHRSHRYKSTGTSIHEGLRMKVQRNSEGHPLFVHGNPTKRKSDLRSKESVMKSCYDYMKDISASTQIRNPSDFSIIHIAKDSLGHTHVKMQQKFLGVPVEGAEVIVHFKNGEPYLFNGRYHVNTGLTDVAAVYGSAYAIDKTIQDISHITTYIHFSPEQQAMLDYSAPGSDLTVYNIPGTTTFALAWHVSIRPNLLEVWDYYIDAKTGVIIHKSNQTCSSGPATTSSTDLNNNPQTLNTYLSGATYYMIDASKSMYSAANSTIPSNPVGAIWTLDAQHTDLTSVAQITSSNNTWSKTATSAHYNAGVCYDYYKNTHSRNSLDNNGGTIISVINVTSGGQEMDNAYWNGKFMAYGNGNVAFKPLAGGLDVAAHEMTHGVVSNTANLEYSGQSGAINESMADIFGCMVERNGWKIGDNVVLPAYFPSGALRDLSDPHNGGTGPGDNGWQPRIMSEYVNTSQDNGGVHTNSGIPNYAYYLFATGTGMNMNKAELVYYRALNNYLVRSSQFIDLRLAVVQAATDLYGAASPEVTAAKAAFDAVEIFDGTGGNYQNNIPSHTASGSGFILFRNTDATDPTTLYLGDVAANNAAAVSTTSVSEKPSVTDDGSTAYFATTAGSIKKITLTPGSTNETLIDAGPGWSNVAVSKDGSKLAATTVYEDSAIFVYDFATTTWRKFHLYNPTFSTGITTDGPVYADAIEWDYTGEYIIYDCFNALPDGTDSIAYWDIGIMKVWDNNTNTADIGTIEKVFTNLPEGISVGNPTFSKNSPYIIAFDYIDQTTGTDYYSVLAYNTQTGDISDVFDNYTLGYPSYSVDDSQIAFTSIDVSGPPYPEMIAVVDMNADKITPTASPAGISNFSEIPVWFAKGARTTGTVRAKSSSLNSSVYPNPTEGQFHLNYELKNSNKVDITICNTLGQTVKTLISENQVPGTYDYDFSLADLNTGTYMIKILSGEEFSNAKIVKIK